VVVSGALVVVSGALVVVSGALVVYSGALVVVLSTHSQEAQSKIELSGQRVYSSLQGFPSLSSQFPSRHVQSPGPPVVASVVVVVVVVASVVVVVVPPSGVVGDSVVVVVVSGPRVVKRLTHPQSPQLKIEPSGQTMYSSPQGLPS